MSSIPTRSMPPPLARWYRRYYLLALFNIAAICFSLFVNHRIMRLFVTSVDADRVWVGISGDVSQLSELAANINTPGNDAFRSRDIEAERRRLRQAYIDFRVRLAPLIRRIQAQSPNERTASLLQDLTTARLTVASMVRDATLTLAFLADQQVERATEHMADMDRQYASLNSSLVRMRLRIGSLQQEQFAERTAFAELFQKLEYVIASLITLMVLGTAAYSRIMAHRIQEVSGLKALYQQELELRLEERTAYLREANDSRAALVKQLMSAQEDERRRMARDLHDHMGQSLTYLVVALRRLSESAQPDDRGHIDLLRETASKTLDEARRLARGLRPSILDDLGLIPAIESLTDEFAEHHAVTVSLESSLDPSQRLAPAVETALYRIVQESLTNVARHARATDVQLRFWRDPREMHVMVRDNGRGLDRVDAATSPWGPTGIGLASIRERAEILGGRVVIESAPGKGTTVQVNLPLDPNFLPPPSRGGSGLGST